MKRMSDFLKRQWFLFVVLLTISLIVLLFEVL